MTSVSGDFNGDGLLDLALVDAVAQLYDYEASVVVFLGKGGGEMAEASRSSATSIAGGALATGDFDRDGKLDLIILRNETFDAGSGGKVYLCRGDGAGGLAPPDLVTTGMMGSPIAADLDGDGRSDLVFGTAFLTGNGDGTFQLPRPLPVSGYTTTAAIADLDGDGRPDLVTSGTESIAVFLNRGSLSFERIFDVVGGRPRVVRVGDVDGDGRADLVVGDILSGVGVLYGLGNGRFLPAVGASAGASSVEVGDFNGDGRSDVVVQSGSGYAVLMSDSFGFLQKTAEFSSFGGNPLIGDFDGDGIDDVVSMGAFSAPGLPVSGGALFRSNGDGTFVVAQPVATAYATRLTSSDVNRDGKPDLAWMSPNVGFGTMRGNGAGGFAPAVITSFTVPYFDGVFADMTGDGIPDAVVTASALPAAALYVLPGDGTGKFGSAITTTFGTFDQIRPPLVADFNGDGHGDVAFLLNGQLNVLLGDGTGHFPTARSPVTVPYGDLKVSDLNADGKPDLVVVSANGDIGGDVVPLLNDGTGVFTIGADIAFTFLTASILVTDADGDGRPDLLSTWGGVVTFRKGDGAGGFGAAVDTPAPAAWRSLVPADLDGDGILDLLTGYPSTAVLKGRGDGTYESVGFYPFPTEATLAVDFTGDGKPDVVGTFSGVTWLVPNTTCVARRLQLDAWPPSCGTAGAPFATQPTVRVLDDAGNPVLCGGGPVLASLEPGSGPAGAVLSGTTSVPLTSGVAHFDGLSIDKPGGGYRVRFDLAGSRGTATPLFSQSLPAPVITGPTQTCSGSPARFEGGRDADFWTWTLDGAVVGTAPVLSLPALPAGTHDLALAIRSGACASSASVTLPVLASIPAPAASSNSPVPFGGTLQLNASTIPGAFFRWAGPDGFTSALQNPAIPLVKEQASGRYTVVATVGTCASADAATDVVVLSPTCAGCPNASFGPAVRALAVPAFAIGVAVADFDGDGITDIVTAHNDSNGTIAFLRGNGRGGFAAPVASASHLYYPGAPSTADLDGNGLRDLVTTSYGGIWVALQTSPGHFAGAVAHTINGNVLAVAIADVNGDGVPDIVTANGLGGGLGSPVLPGTVAVLLGDGAGGFAAPTYVPAGLEPAALFTRDLDGDGMPDLVVANSGSNSVFVFLGDGAGGFALQTTLAVPGPPTALTTGDVTGNGVDDLVVGIAGSDPAAMIFEGSASGALAFVRSLPIDGGSRLLLADLNGDGHADLVTLAGGVVQVRLGLGAAGFSAPESYPAAGNAVDLAAGDVDGDGRIDVVVGTASRVLLLAGDGNGGLPSLPALGNFAAPPGGLKFVDLNADGRPDLVVSATAPNPSVVEVYLAGVGGFTLATTLFPPDAASVDWFTTGDADGDGIPDVIVVDRRRYLFVFRGLGSGLFKAPVTTDLGHEVTFLAAGDVNSDGRTDVLLGPSLSSGGSTVVLFGNVAGGFGSAVPLPVSIWNPTVAIGDVNGDGTGDVVARDDTTGGLVVYLWNGTSFSPGTLTPVDATLNALVLGDFDRDGKTDVVVAVVGQYAGSTPGLRFLSGNNAGGFAAPVAFGAASVFSALLASDFNGDGALDFAATMQNDSSVAVFMGDGHGTFASAAEFTGGGVGAALATADVDGDGKQDLAFLRTNPPGVAFLTNSNCVPSRLGVTGHPSCVLAGQGFNVEVGVFDDGLNVVSCLSGVLTARIVPGTGAAGAILSGTTSVPATSGFASFPDLAVNRDGRRYRVEVSHPLATRAWTAPFSIGAVPPSTITGPPRLCAGTSAWSAPTGYDTYSWAIDGTAVSNARTLTPAFLSAGSHILDLTVTRDRCPARSSVPISNAPPELSSIAPSHGVSQGGTFVSLAAACVAPGATLTLGGSLADPSVPAGAPPLKFFTSGHTPGPVDAVLANPDGQTATLATGYTYECDTQAPIASSNSPRCVGSTVVLGVPDLPGATYSWTGPNGFTAATRCPTIPNANQAGSGVYIVTVGVFGCTMPPASTTVVVNPTPSAAITAPASVSAWSTGNVASVPDAGPGSFYNWYPTTGATGIHPPFNERSVTFDAGVAGEAGLTVTVASGGCQSFGNVSIPISPVQAAFNTIIPCRLVDTRVPGGPGGGPALAAGSPGRRFPVAGQCGIPAGAVAVAINATVTGSTSAGFLRLHAGASPQPLTSNLSFGASQTRAGSSIVMLATDGTVTVESGQPAGTVHVILDANGYFR